MLHDLRYALRQLSQNRGFAAVAILTLALGIGVNTAIFSLADGMLFRPLPFRAADRLVMIKGFVPKTGLTYSRVDRVDYEQIRGNHTGIAGVAVLEDGRAYTWAGTEGAESISSVEASPNVLDVLGVTAAVGRPLRPGDEAQVPRLAMLTHEAWRRRFALDPSVVGRTITFDQGSVEIVGILPPRFVYPLQGPLVQGDLLMVSAPDPKEAANPKAGVWTPIARLKEGVRLVQAQAEVDTLVRRAAQQFPDTPQDRALKVVELQYAMFELSRPMLWLLFGAAGFVVLIGCANLASLLMARGTGRLREIGIRAAIGANRARLIRQLLTESLVLGALGAVAAILVASVVFQSLVLQVPSGLYRLVPEGIDTRAAIFALSVSILAGLLFGILPALRLSMPDLISAMRGSGSTGAAAAGIAKTGVLVAVEVALGVILLCGAGLMANSLVRMRTVDLGFEPSRALSLWVSPPRTRYPTSDHHYDFQMQLLQRARKIPGVAVAGGIESLQIGGYGRPRGLGPNMPRDGGLWGVTPGYFAAIGSPILQGRDLTEREGVGDVPVALVNEAAARQLWPADAAVGKTLRLEGWPPFEIIGVVKDVRYGYGRAAVPSVYRPLSRQQFRTLMIVARVNGDPKTVAAALRTEAQRLDPRIVISRPDTLSNALSRGFATSRFQTTLFGLFAVLGLLLAAVGIFGVMAHWVIGRTREMGVRLALGADPRDLRRLVLGQASRPLLLGVVVGLGGALALTRKLQASLYEITPYDPATLAGASVLLVAVGIAAAYLPARRASRVDPIIALRSE